MKVKIRLSAVFTTIWWGMFTGMSWLVFVGNIDLHGQIMGAYLIIFALALFSSIFYGFSRGGEE